MQKILIGLLCGRDAGETSGVTGDHAFLPDKRELRRNNSAHVEPQYRTR